MQTSLGTMSPTNTSRRRRRNAAAHQKRMRRNQKQAEERKEAASVAVAVAAVASLIAYEEAAPALLAENARLRARVEQAEETIRKLRAQLNTNQNTYIAIGTTCY